MVFLCGVEKDMPQGYRSYKMASLERLELSTHCLEGSCSIHLSYRDVS